MKTRSGVAVRLVLVVSVAVSCLACGGATEPAPSPSTTPAAATATEPAVAPVVSATPSLSPTVDVSPTATATPTSVAQSVVETPTPLPTSACQGLLGSLEVRVLVGPADAVGLEPVAVGTLPFAVTTDETPYMVEGGGAIAYNEVLAKEWGTYAVTLDMMGTVLGECTDGGLVLAVEMSGSQLVKVESEGFRGEYPWEGTHDFDIELPLEEGATVEGEGWAFVLHLNAR